jgi:hypothetical protein
MFYKLLQLLSLVLLMPVLSSYAGQANDVPVTIDGTLREAYGNYKTARFAPSDTTMIGCGSYVSINDLATGSMIRGGFCQARDASGTTAFCSIITGAIADKVSSISDYSYVRFLWNEDGICTFLSVSTQSFYIPGGVE